MKKSRARHKVDPARQILTQRSNITARNPSPEITSSSSSSGKVRSKIHFRSLPRFIRLPLETILENIKEGERNNGKAGDPLRMIRGEGERFAGRQRERERGIDMEIQFRDHATRNVVSLAFGGSEAGRKGKDSTRERRGAFSLFSSNSIVTTTKGMSLLTRRAGFEASFQTGNRISNGRKYSSRGVEFN